jgi:hypothetical protein
MNLDFLHVIGDGLRTSWMWFLQNGTPFGILLAFPVNIITLVVLLRTLRAVNRQAIAADRQAQAAEQQASVSREQMAVLEQQRVAAERGAEAAEKQAQAAQAATAVAEAQRIATEQAAHAARMQSELTRHDLLSKLRPILVITRRPNPNPTLSDVVYAVNHGAGPALDVKVRPRGPNVSRNVGIVTNILGPGQDTLVSTDVVTIKREGIQALYESQDGRHFATVMEPSNNESFFHQSAFEIDIKGGWQAQPAIPPAI